MARKWVWGAGRTSPAGTCRTQAAVLEVQGDPYTAVLQASPSSKQRRAVQGSFASLNRLCQQHGQRWAMSFGPEQPLRVHHTGAQQRGTTGCP